MPPGLPNAEGKEALGPEQQSRDQLPLPRPQPGCGDAGRVLGPQVWRLRPGPSTEQGRNVSTKAGSRWPMRVRDGAPIWLNSRLVATTGGRGTGPTGSWGQHLTPSSSNVTEGRGLAGNGENLVPGATSGVKLLCRRPRPAGLWAQVHRYWFSCQEGGGPPKEVTREGAAALLWLGLCGWGSPERPLPRLLPGGLRPQ